MMEHLRIFGAGVRARIFVDLLAWEGAGPVQVEGYYDDRLAPGSTGPAGHPVLGNVEQGLAELPGSGRLAFVAMGTRASARAYQTFLRLSAAGVRLHSIVSARAHVSPSAQVGQNALVPPGVFLGCNVRAGHMFCAHGGAVVEHDGSIGDNVLLAPGVALASSVRVGSHCFLGVGCKLVPQVEVGQGTLLGAGSVVLRNLPSYVIAYGHPAVAVRRTRAGDEVPTEEEIAGLQAAPVSGAKP